MRLNSLALILGVIASTFFAACGAPQRSEDALSELPPPALLRAEALERDVFLRQSVHARWATGETRFDAIVQKEGARLQLLGLSPAGQVGFVFTLEGGELTAENRSGRALPFSPAWIVADVQRAFYPAEAHQDPDVMRESELRLIERASEDGLPLRRELFRGDQLAIAIDYEGYGARRIAPETIRIENIEYGYHLTIETLEEAYLDED